MSGVTSGQDQPVVLLDAVARELTDAGAAFASMESPEHLVAAFALSAGAEEGHFRIDRILRGFVPHDGKTHQVESILIANGADITHLVRRAYDQLLATG